MNSDPLAEFRTAKLPSEAQIMADWRDPDGPPLVSVLCTTYNQVAYLEDALRGFLLQKTDFPFEIVVHDDASSDGTTALIRAYQQRYPRLIRPIIQTENQYSQGRQVYLLAGREARGQYFCLCDGDDFWIDAQKLAVQVAALQANPDCRLCFHLTRHLLNHDEQLVQTSLQGRLRRLAVYPQRAAILSPRAIIIGDGAYIATASVMLSRAAWLKLPAWMDRCPVGDFFIQALCAQPGGALFIPREMSVYRLATLGSWTSTTLANPQRAATFYTQMCASLQDLDQHLGGRYHGEIDRLTRRLLASWRYYSPSPTAQGAETPRRDLQAGSALFYHSLIQHLVLFSHCLGAAPARPATTASRPLPAMAWQDSSRPRGSAVK